MSMVGPGCLIGRDAPLVRIAAVVLVATLTAPRAFAQANADTAAAPAPTEAPKRTHLVADVAAGWSFASPTLSPSDAPSDAPDAYANVSGSGFVAELGVGVRRAFTARFEGKLRLGFGLAMTHGSTSYSAASSDAAAQPFYEEGSGTGTFWELSPEIDAGLRFRPSLRAPWFIGLGPLLRGSILVGSATVDATRTNIGILGGSSQAVTRSVSGKTHLGFGGLLETGVLLGPDERLEVGARVSAAVENDGSAAFRLLVGAGWAFF